MTPQKSFFRKFLFATTLLFLSFSLTSMKADKAYDPSGNWSYEIMAGENVLTGDMTIKKVKKSYEVEIESDVYGHLQLESVDFDKNTLTANVDVQGVNTEFEMEFDKDIMTGKIVYDGQELPLSAERKK